MAANDRTERSPSDPNWRWKGPDVTTRPTPNELDEIRRKTKGHDASLPGSIERTTVEFALGPNPSEAAVIVHDLGLANHAPSFAFVRRILALEARVAELEEKLKLKS